MCAVWWRRHEHIATSWAGNLAACVVNIWMRINFIHGGNLQDTKNDDNVIWKKKKARFCFFLFLLLLLTTTMLRHGEREPRFILTQHVHNAFSSQLGIFLQLLFFCERVRNNTKNINKNHKRRKLFYKASKQREGFALRSRACIDTRQSRWRRKKKNREDKKETKRRE